MGAVMKLGRVWLSSRMHAASAAVALLLSVSVVNPALAQEQPPVQEARVTARWQEIKLFGYIENSYVVTFGRTTSGGLNDLRFYDLNEGYTFNIAELSVKKDPSEPFPFGFGVVMTAGIDSQKNHALGIFRGLNDPFPYRNTPEFDLQEAYLSGRVPVGQGLTLKAGKWVTLVGTEGLESPNDLNFSRSFLYTLGTPYTHVGVLASYQVFDWLGVAAGLIDGWDNVEVSHWGHSFTGQFAFTPINDFTANLNWIVGPEQPSNNRNQRYLLDWTFNYTGTRQWTLALNVDVAGEQRDPAAREDDSAWWGAAAYAAYDWTPKLRSALRVEYFGDPDGARTGAGRGVSLWEVTATQQYKIWRGLVVRLEYRHDSADQNVFKFREDGRPSSSSQDTLTFDVYYLFF